MEGPSPPPSAFAELELAKLGWLTPESLVRSYPTDGLLGSIFGGDFLLLKGKAYPLQRMSEGPGKGRSAIKVAGESCLISGSPACSLAEIEREFQRRLEAFLQRQAQEELPQRLGQQRAAKKIKCMVTQALKRFPLQVGPDGLLYLHRDSEGGIVRWRNRLWYVYLEVPEFMLEDPNAPGTYYYFDPTRVWSSGGAGIAGGRTGMMTKRVDAVRYERQRQIPNWDQERLAQAHLVLIGAGPLAQLLGAGLAALGVGRILIVDNEQLSEGESERGLLRLCQGEELKAAALAKLLAKVNPDLEAEAFPVKILKEQFFKLLSLEERPDLIIEVTNGPASKWAALRYARMESIPALFGAAGSAWGKMILYHPARSAEAREEDYLLQEFEDQPQGLPSLVIAGLMLEETWIIPHAPRWG